MPDETDIYPALDHIAITPSDATTYDNPRLRGLFVGMAGTVSVKCHPTGAIVQLHDAGRGHFADQRLPGQSHRHCGRQHRRLDLTCARWRSRISPLSCCCGGGSSTSPAIRLSGLGVFQEDIAAGAALGTLSVVNVTGTPTYLADRQRRPARGADRRQPDPRRNSMGL